MIISHIASTSKFLILTPKSHHSLITKSNFFQSKDIISFASDIAER